MRNRTFFVALLLASAAAWADSRLTQTENEWLANAAPVISYAQQQGLPLDIIVVPQARAGDSPLAMGLRDGRCKLVLAMRGNPAVEEISADIPKDLFPAAVEAMTAHEVAHCWRHVQGAWATLPSGFADAPADVSSDKEIAEMQREMRETRREEGFADLVAMAWTLHSHPSQYARVLDWLTHTRSDVTVPGEQHDTGAWVSLASDPGVFAVGHTPFEQAFAPWEQGLLNAR